MSRLDCLAGSPDAAAGVAPGSPLAADPARGIGAGCGVDRAGGEGGWGLLDASRWTVLLLTSTPASARASRMSSREYPCAWSSRICSPYRRALRERWPGGPLGCTVTAAAFFSAWPEASSVRRGDDIGPFESGSTWFTSSHFHPVDGSLRPGLSRRRFTLSRLEPMFGGPRAQSPSAFGGRIQRPGGLGSAQYLVQE